MTDTSAAGLTHGQRALLEELDRNLARAGMLASTLTEQLPAGLERATVQRIHDGLADPCASTRFLLDESPVDDRPDLRFAWCSTCSWRQTHRWLRGEWVCVYCGTALMLAQTRRSLAVVQGGAA